MDSGYIRGGLYGLEYIPPGGYKPQCETKRDFHLFGSLVLLERHKYCECSYCGRRDDYFGIPDDKAMKFGVNLPECKRWNAWIVIHWNWRGSKWYLRFTRGRLFGSK